MSIPKHLTFSYFYETNQNKIITPVGLYPIPFNSSLVLMTDALWDTGANMSAITPKIQQQLKAPPIDKKAIAGIHSTQVVDVVYITILSGYDILH